MSLKYFCVVYKYKISWYKKYDSQKRVYGIGGIFLPWDSYKVCWVGHFYTTTLNQKKMEQIFHKNFDLAKNWQNEFEIDQKWYFWHFLQNLALVFLAINLN